MSWGCDPLIGLVILTAGVRSGIALVHLAVSPQVGDDREMPTTVLDFTFESCNQRVSRLMRVFVEKSARMQEGCTYASLLCGCTCESAMSWAA